MKQKTHNLLWRGIGFISPFKHPFDTPYPTILHQFAKSEVEVIHLGDIELPLLRYEEVDKDDYGNTQYALYLFHPEFPSKVLRWRQKGLNVGKRMRKLIKQLSESDQPLSELDQLPIIKITADEPLQLYDNTYIPPKIEIIDFIEPTPEMSLLRDGKNLALDIKPVMIIDKDGVMAEKIPTLDDMTDMLNLLLEYSQVNLRKNGKKPRIIRFDILSYKEEEMMNSIRMRYMGDKDLTSRQFETFVGLYRVIVEDIVG